MHLLRDRKALTRLLMLMEILERRPSRIRTIADTMDMSVQGASDHLKEMEGEGLVERVDGEFRPTTEGIQFLHEAFGRLREFVVDKGRSLDIVGSCFAVAGNRVRRGDPVGLVMEEGHLRAYSGADEASKGVARSNGKKGEAILVGELSGVVDITPGCIHLFRVEASVDKGPRSDGRVSLPLGRAKKALASRKPDVVGAAGVSAAALLRALGREADFSLAPGPSAVEAAGRGQDVLLFVSSEDAEAVVAAIEEGREGPLASIEYSWV